MEQMAAPTGGGRGRGNPAGGVLRKREWRPGVPLLPVECVLVEVLREAVPLMVRSVALSGTLAGGLRQLRLEQAAARPIREASGNPRPPAALARAADHHLRACRVRRNGVIFPLEKRLLLRYHGASTDAIGFIMVPEPIRQVVSDLLPLVRQFAPGGEYAIALGGSYAKGTADDDADVDLYLFAHSVLAGDERKRIASAFSSEIETVVSWGNEEPFRNAGTDFLFRGHNVECWLRDIGHIERSIAECREGVVKREFVTWTTTGFYNHCCLSDLTVMVPLDDPFDIIARWKSQVATYPPRLRQAIVNHHLAAAGFWPENFHYLSAIERQDVIYATGIVQQVVHNLVQVLFGLNEVYFPGDKRLDVAMAHLPRQPANLCERIHALLFPGTPATADVLRGQREALRSLLGDVRDMAARTGADED